MYELLKNIIDHELTEFTREDIRNIVTIHKDTITNNLRRLVKIGLINKEECNKKGKSCRYYITNEQQQTIKELYK